MSRVQLKSLPEGTIEVGGTFAPAVGAQVNVYAHDANSTVWGKANAPVPVTIYADETSEDVEHQPLYTDANGQVPGWVVADQTLDIVATYQGVQSAPMEANAVAGADITDVMNAQGSTYGAQVFATGGGAYTWQRRAIPVLGAFDGETASDATITAGSLAQVVSAIIGPWAVGKTVVIFGAKVGNLGLVTTIASVSGTTATLQVPADLAVTNAQIRIGTDDTAAWTAAIAQLPTANLVGRTLIAPDGISICKTLLRMPGGCNLQGAGKGATVLQLAAAGASLAFGPAFAGAAGAPLSFGRSASFSVDGGLIATQPLLINAVNGSFDDIGCIYGAGDGVVCGGQNCTLDNLNSGAHIGSNLVLDNGCGDYCFEKPELNFAGKYHIEIRSSRNAEGIGYGIPEYNYFNEGICEARNSFVPGGTIGIANVLITAGRFNMFNDMNFYVDGWGAGDVSQAMVRIRGAATGAGNPDTGYGTNGDHEFRNCTWSGPGSGVGIEHDNIDGSGNVQPFFAVFRPYLLSGHSIFAGLNYAESHASASPPRRQGQVSYA